MKQLILSMILLFLASNAHAGDAVLYDKVPITYIGKFRWQNSSDIHQVVFTWNSQKEGKEGSISLEGRGTYGTGKKTEVKIKGLVEPKSRRIEIWESAEGAANFATDQSHIGTISPDLKTIETVWTTQGYSRNRGELKLIRKEGHR